MCLSLLDVVEGTRWFQCEYFIYISIQKKGGGLHLRLKAPYFRFNVKHRKSTTTKENIFALHLSQILKTLLNRFNQATMRLRSVVNLIVNVMTIMSDVSVLWGI